MWPYSETEADWLAAAAAPPVPAAPADITPALLDFYIHRGRRLRAEAMARSLRQFGAALRQLVVGDRPARHGREAPGDESLALVANGLRSPLTSIRSSAEILRDNPDIDSSERSRFLAIVLAEEARLENLVSQMLGASSISGGSRLWQVRLGDLKLENEPGRVCCP